MCGHSNVIYGHPSSARRATAFTEWLFILAERAWWVSSKKPPLMLIYHLKGNWTGVVILKSHFSKCKRWNHTLTTGFRISLNECQPEKQYLIYFLFSIFTYNICLCILCLSEASKLVMSYVAAVCGKGTEVNQVKEQLLQSNPVLEGKNGVLVLFIDNKQNINHSLDHAHVTHGYTEICMMILYCKTWNAVKMPYRWQMVKSHQEYIGKIKVCS